MTESQPTKSKRSKGFYAALISFALLAGAVGGGLFIAQDSLTSFLSRFQVADYEGTGGPVTRIEIANGDSGADVARKMVDADIVKSFDAVYRDMLRTDFTIFPGVYEFPTQIPGQEALRLLIEGSGKITLTSTIPEGFKISQIIPKLAADFELPEQDFSAAIAAIMGQLPDAALNAEGYLFPATYTFDPGVSARDIIDAMLARTEAELAKHELTLKSSFDVIRLASVLQAEARNTEDFYKASRVFLNRLDIGMLLQSDATVNYGTEGEKVTTTDAQRADKSLYNTYVHLGLPIGPISSPGGVAIDAALRPADGDWLYFVTVNLSTGETVFTETFAEHLVAVKEFQAWIRANPSFNE
jgi:UPF0755 protein